MKSPAKSGALNLAQRSGVQVELAIPPLLFLVVALLAIVALDVGLIFFLVIIGAGRWLGDRWGWSALGWIWTFSLPLGLLWSRGRIGTIRLALRLLRRGGLIVTFVLSL